MTKKLRMQTVICSILFTIAAMAVMLFYSANKMVVIANATQEQGIATIEGEKVTGASGETNKIRFMENEDATRYLCIPLQVGTKAENIIIENHYMDKELWIFLDGVKESFYEKNAVSGNLEPVQAGNYEYQSGGTWLKFQLKDVYEYQSVLESNYLYVEFMAPKEVYDKIVVIDAGHGGDDLGFGCNELSEKELVLDIVKRVKLLLDETDIKVYYTRLDDDNPLDSDRMNIANVVKADMFISLHVNHDENAKTSLYGTETLYNDSFFIPGFGSVQLADCLEREVVKAISGKGNGLYEAQEDSLLKKATIPAAVLEIGYLTNKQEAILLARDDYRDKIATGIYNAIMTAYK